jgi:penicillin G amidase
LKKHSLLVLTLGLFLCLGFIFWIYTATLPKMQGTMYIQGNQQPITVEFDDYANPAISASSKTDAFFALGYLTSRERMFQMDLMRRKIAGRLSEVLGDKTLGLDIWHRHYDFTATAAKILQALPEEQRQILHAYANGVNSYLDTVQILPAEFLVLGYSPEPWREEDSILISLSIFQLLNQNAKEERMFTVMKQTLPKDLVAFLTPQDDIYNPSTLLIGNEKFPTATTSIPVAAIKNILSGSGDYQVHGLVDNMSIQAGSNQWAVNKTVDGRAILANDMHLPLSVPNLWYQAALQYDDVNIRGITLPGLPLVIAGSNGYIAWGFTNAQADVLDLVILNKHPLNHQQYKTSTGWRTIETKTERIKVKNAPDHVIKTRRTIWGPVSPKLLMDQEVAIKWTAFYPEAVNLDLVNIAEIRDLSAAVKLFNHAGLPVLNVMLADNKGHIAWTLTGKIPLRNNFDGSTSLSWGEDGLGWQGFVAADVYPRVIDPPSGFLATANNRVLPLQFPFGYGHDFGNSYRAARIMQQLEKDKNFTVDAMYALQLNTKSDFYNFYQQLALSVLSAQVIRNDPGLAKAKIALESWDGFANPDSVGFGLLVKFRQRLADIIFSAYVQQCRKRDKNFHYRWLKMDTPLRQLLANKLPETLPNNADFKNWDTLILTALTQVVKDINQRFPETSLTELEWGQMQSFQLQHPFSKGNHWLSPLLNMPDKPLAGCIYCIRVAKKDFAASMRFVVTPGDEDNMILVLPTGQSGHPLSTHYRDQYDAWVTGRKLKKNPRSASRKLKLVPKLN